MTCTRCSGLLLTRWDDDFHEEEMYCFSCGNIPAIILRREDGRPIDTPRLCEDCHVRPVAIVPYITHKGDKEAARCAGCREVFNRKMRMKKYWKNKKSAAA